MSRYLGDVSAYAYAVSKGYTGTEEEFAELMASYASVAEDAGASARAAASSASDASASKTAAGQSETNAAQSESAAASSAGQAQTAASNAGQSETNAGNSASAAAGSASQAALSATQAANSAQSANLSATDANTAKSGAEEAQSKAETAQTKAEAAQGKAEEAQSEAEQVAQGISESLEQITTNKDNIEDLQTTIEQKANIDGAYSDLTAGNAEQLVSTVYEEDSVPYIFRTAGGSMDIGDREEDMLVGGSIAWNQLVQNGNFTDTTAWTAQNASLAVSDRVATITPSNNGSSSLILQGMSIKDHVYFAAFSVNTPSSTGVVNFEMRDASGIRLLCASSQTGKWERCKGVNKIASSNASGYIRIRTDTAQTAGQAFTVKDVVLFDLTQAFGSTIADYIYSLNTATPGAGVAWFRKLFPKDYYAYNAGSMLHVEGVSAHKTVGFNAWDEVWEAGLIAVTTGEPITGTGIRSKNFCRCVPNTQYYLRAGDSATKYIFWYDADENFISHNFGSRLSTSPSNAAYFKIRHDGSVTYANDICINLSWDGERDGEYEPYVKHSYPLDSSLTLRGIPKLDSANNLYYDGDTYESDGTVTRRYGVVDLGTLNWVYSESGVYFYSLSLNTDDSNKAKYKGQTVSGLYKNRTFSDNPPEDMLVCIANSTNVPILRIANFSYTNVADFKAAMSGVYLVYELATPTTETAEPYQNPQIVDDFGTEEYVTTSIIPVGHVTKYQPNLRAKLEMSPDSPDGDGDYIVRQANGENSYVSLASTTTIQDILARLTALEGGTT